MNGCVGVEPVPRTVVESARTDAAPDRRSNRATSLVAVGLLPEGVVHRLHDASINNSSRRRSSASNPETSAVRGTVVYLPARVELFPPGGRRPVRRCPRPARRRIRRTARPQQYKTGNSCDCPPENRMLTLDGASTARGLGRFRMPVDPIKKTRSLLLSVARVHDPRLFLREARAPDPVKTAASNSAAARNETTLLGPAARERPAAGHVRSPPMRLCWTRPPATN